MELLRGETGGADHVAKIYVSEIQPNQDVATSFAIAEMQLRTARNGTQFLTLKLLDKTGEVTGRVWERAEEISRGLAGQNVALVKGRSELFRDELQLNIQEISALPVNNIDPADYLPVCPIEPELLLEKLKRIISRIRRRPIHQLMMHFLADRDLLGRFRRAPAAKSIHHAYLGGLLEHSVSVAELVISISHHYPELDRDTLIAGALLHDVGKVHEYVYDLTIDYSHAGRLLGHTVMGAQILEDQIRDLNNFPEEDAMLLKHLILSHHGLMEHGAARVPMTREAFVLHLADDLDAKMNNLGRVLSESGGSDGAWTSYQSIYQRSFFKGLSREVEGPAPLPGETPEEEKGVQLSLWQQMKKKRKAGP